MTFWNTVAEHLRPKLADKSDIFKWVELTQTTIVGEATPYQYELIKDTKYRDYCTQYDDEIITRNLWHQAYRLWKFEEESSIRIEDLSSVYEIGGGIGMMYVLLKTIRPDIRYEVADLPEMLEVQKHVIENVVGMEYKCESVGNTDLFIALCSLSEIECFATRDNLLRECKHYLITYQPTFGRINNIAWFNNNLPKDRKWYKPENFYIGVE